MHLSHAGYDYPTTDEYRRKVLKQELHNARIEFWFGPVKRLIKNIYYAYRGHVLAWEYERFSKRKRKQPTSNENRL